MLQGTYPSAGALSTHSSTHSSPYSSPYSSGHDPDPESGSGQPRGGTEKM